MWAWIISFFSNFSWISGAWKVLKGFINPLSIASAVIIAILIGGNYYFYEKSVSLKKQAKKEALKYKNLSLDLEELKAKNIQIQKLLNSKETEFKEALKKTQILHVNQIKETSLHAKQKEKNKHLKDASISPVLRSTLNSMFSDANATNTN